MTTISNSLLDFILSLLRDPQAAAAFTDDPQATLSAAGLGDVCSADVRALMPMLSDYAPMGSGYGAVSAFTAQPHSGGQSSGPSDHGSWSGRPAPHDGGQGGGQGGGHGGDQGGQPEQGSDHDGYLAIEHIRYIQANYTYNNNVTTTTVDASHSIWGDSYKIFGDDNVVATGGSVAAGDDVGHASVDNSSHLAVVDSFNRTATTTTTTNTTTNDVHGDGNAVGTGTEVSDSFNPSHSLNTDINDSGNTQTGTGNVVGEHNDVSTDNSGNTLGAGSAVGDGSHAGLNTDISNSGNTATDSGNTALNSGNTVGGNGNAGGVDNTATNTDVDLHAHDIVLGTDNNVGNALHLDDHSYSSSDGNETNIAGGGIDQSEHETDSHAVSDSHDVTGSYDGNAFAGHGDATGVDVAHNAVDLPVL